MQPVADRVPRRVISVACGCVFAVLTAMFADVLIAQADVPVSTPVKNLHLELKRSDAQQTELTGLLQAQQTPGSPNYHKWLTPEQFAERFAPSASTAQATVDWLQQQGFQAGAVSRNGMRVSFAGSAGQVQRAFGVRVEAQPADLQAGRVVLSGRSRGAAKMVSGGGDDAAARLLAEAVETNAAVVVLPASSGNADTLRERQELLEEAAAQGITVLQAAGRPDDSPSGSVALLIAPGGQAIAPDAAVARPDWQSASGLPGDGLRAAPDATLLDAGSLVKAVAGYAAQHGRLGPISPWLYRFADDTTVFKHADASVAAGTWSPLDGLGTVQVDGLMRAIAAAEAGTAVTLSASNTTVTHGQPLTLTVSVATNGGQPSGTVTATLAGRSGNTVTLGPIAVASTGSGAYGATLSSSTLPGDVYDLSAVFTSGTTATKSNTVTTTVNPEDVLLTATAPATSVGSSIPVKVTATSASGVGVPSGAVTVTAYASATPTVYSAVLPASTTSSASTVVNVPATAVGKLTLLANCTSNSSFACNQPTSFAATVTQETPTVTLNSNAQALAANSATQKYDLTVSVASTSGSATAPTGTVTLQNNGVTVTTLTLAKGAAAYTISLSGTGNSLTAVYNGDASYAATTSAAVVVNAPLITTTTTLTGSPTSFNFGSSTSLTASVTPAAYAASGAPTGTITLRSSLQGVIGTATLANGFVTYTAAALQVGSHSITATYSGDGNYATSIATPLTITVAQGKVASLTTLTVSPDAPLAGQNTTLTATVKPNFSVPAGTVTPSVTCTGQVTFFSNNVFVANGALSGGTVSVTARLPVGSDSLTAVYGGDTQCYGSTAPALVVSPARVASALTLQPSVGYANAGQTIQLKASVAGADAGTIGLPTGTITFYDTRGGIQITVGTAVLSGATSTTAVAAINVNGSGAGQHSFSAAYGGDGIFLPATSDAATVFFGDFSVAFNPSSLSVPQGGSGSAVASLAVTNGFSAAVVMTCAPPGGSSMQCSFQPSSVTAGGSGALTVTTAAQGSKAVRASRGTVLTGAGAALAGLLLVPFRRTRRVAALLLMLCCFGLAVGGCGLGMVDSTNNLNGSGAGSGAGSSAAGGGTPLGTQLLTVTAASADGTLKHTYTFPVTVQ